MLGVWVFWAVDMVGVSIMVLIAKVVAMLMRVSLELLKALTLMNTLSFL